MSSSVLVALRVKASPEHAFDVFTQDIGRWWRPDPLFQITRRGDGVLSFEDGQLVTRFPDGEVFEVGRVTEWRRGEMLIFTWKHETLTEEQETRVEVVFEVVGHETRVSIRHFGWLEIPREHVARHRFPDLVTQQRVVGWWCRSLAAFEGAIGGDS